MVANRRAGLALQRHLSPGAGVAVRVGEVLELSARILVVAGVNTVAGPACSMSSLVARSVVVAVSGSALMSPAPMI
jgi:hypothetical protein